ncbi:unnamed protein product [Rotaria sordida]|uniref:Uncharacterized protein n=1 Tax=Rotaria sordida TaxID=392033 RepID=A0A819PF59_9BILA|nr:unnamed protein product [Rotaria sordida]
MKIAFTTNQLQLLIFHLFFMDRRALTTEAIRSVVYQADLAALDPRDLFYNDDERNWSIQNSSSNDVD